MKKIKMSMNNIHRLIIASTVISVKFNEDDYFSNEHYAKIGGISLQELNNLEEEFINNLNWVTWIDLELFEKYSSYLLHYESLIQKEK